MSDRRSRGASRSSNCFQTSSAFGFLFFIFGSTVGIRGVESRKKKKEFNAEPTENAENTENTEAGARRSQRKGKSAAGRCRGAACCAPAWLAVNDWAKTRDDQDQRCRGSTSQQGKSPSRGEMRRKKKKGETAVGPQTHPRVIIPELKRFASP